MHAAVLHPFCMPVPPNAGRKFRLTQRSNRKVKPFSGDALMKRWFMTICFLTLAVSVALTQQAATVQLSSKPASESAIQAVSRKSVQNKMNSARPVNYVAYVRDNATSPDSAPAVIKKQVAEVSGAPFSAGDLPTTMRVQTSTLLELHGMRNSAVSLCLQLPTKYRTHLPQCADIFKHEIRLEALAKDRK